MDRARDRGRGGDFVVSAGPATAIDASSRAASIATMGETTLDVLVVGGGIVGAGAALDAAGRGLSVGLVEAGDFASGTSSRSTKLIHGGLRYLKMLDFVLVREALGERGLLSEVLAPHLVRPMPFLLPIRRRIVERPFLAAGIALYDLLGTRGGGGRLPRQAHLSRRALYRENPGLVPGRFAGAIRYYDAQVDDARFVLSVLRTAAGLGASIAARCEVVGIDRDEDRVRGATVRDLESGEEFTVRARSVIVATGAWTEATTTLAGAGQALSVRPSKGVHLTVSKEKIALSCALIVPTSTSVLFVIPFEGEWLIGTTDTPWRHDPGQTVASDADVTYLLEQVNRVLSTPIGRADVLSVTAGLRPLIAGAAEQSTKLSREHAVGTPSKGLVVVSGGKYTTYRIMAEDAVDAAADFLGGSLPPSGSARTPLVGATGAATLGANPGALARQWGLDPELIQRLVHRYGGLVDTVLEPSRADPSLLEELGGGAGYLRAEARYGVTHEGALHAADVLRRRLRVDLASPDRGLAALSEVVELMGDLLDWDDRRRRAEEDDYRRLVEAELGAEEAADDDAAVATYAFLRSPGGPGR